jgi:hypothetical protein
MQAVRLVKALKLRLHGRHGHTQLLRDLLNPEIAGSKVKDLRLAPCDLNTGNVLQIIIFARLSHTPTKPSSGPDRRCLAHEPRTLISRLGWFPPKVSLTACSVNAHPISSLRSNMTHGKQIKATRQIMP